MVDETLARLYERHIVPMFFSIRRKYGGFLHIPRYLDKPEYLFRPSQIFRRLFRRQSAGAELVHVGLPWGLGIAARPTDAIGKAILSTGVFDLAVTELIWRLVDPGDYVVDAGANIGYLTGMMARRTGPHGTVLGIEAHPGVFSELRDNVAKWTGTANLGDIHLLECAVGSTNGDGHLIEPKGFSQNRGLARLESVKEVENRGESTMYDVPLKRLDSLAGRRNIGLLKIDVEGGELEVLRGAVGLLERHAIRDIVFEDFSPPPSDAMTLLRAHGYSIFAVARSLLGPALVSPDGSARKREWESPSYLATNLPDRAAVRMSQHGWRCLRPR